MTNEYEALGNEMLQSFFEESSLVEELFNSPDAWKAIEQFAEKLQSAAYAEGRKDEAESRAEASGEAEKQTHIALLAECRGHLPLAAASWNDDEDRTVANFHVNRILDLIKRLDAALAKVPKP